MGIFIERRENDLGKFISCEEFSGVGVPPTPYGMGTLHDLRVINEYLYLIKNLLTPNI